MTVVEDIKSKLDIVAYIGRTVSLKKAGRVYKACCPFHSEKTPSFVVNPEYQSWRCFGACAEGGDIFKFAMKQNGWTFREAVDELAKLAGVEVRAPSPEQKAQDETYDRLRGLVKLAAEFYHERLLDASDRGAQDTLAYAKDKRALTEATIQRFQIGYAPPGWQTLTPTLLHLGYSDNDLVLAGLSIRSDDGRLYDRFRNRLLIPIRDGRGRPVGFGARALAPDDQPKYLNSPQSPVFDKSRLLFGLDTAGRAIRDAETVIIVEGYLDAIQAQQAGYANVVAQMGTALTETQLKLVAPRMARKVIMALDSDSAGQNATRRSLEVAREALRADFGGKLGVEFRVLIVPDGKDPDDFIRAHPGEWPKLVEEAQPVAEFVIALESTHLTERSTVAEKEEVARRVLPLLSASENDLYRQDSLQKLAMRLRIGERQLMMWAAEQRPAELPRRSEPPLPDAPPPEYDDFWFGDEEMTPAARPSTALRELARLEAYLLKSLYDQPELVYDVNRRFRELAGADASLQNGPLCDLCAEDFTRAAYQGLLLLLHDALAQDEQAFREFINGRLLEAPEYSTELEQALRGEMDELSPRLAHGLKVDLSAVIRQRDRVGVVMNVQEDAVRSALRLREERIERERIELQFVFDDLAEPDQAEWNQRAALTIRAKRLIDSHFFRTDAAVGSRSTGR
ncbi:MAG TPA: DNA primase [Candidatus Limnocylindrales bacterium]|nr:DNA primase [Candidatus Limnocylindrales bacterium]